MDFHEIKPRKSVDDIHFGLSLQTLVAEGYAEDVDCFDESTKWKTFKKDGDCEFYVKDGSVVCIACFKNCLINGVPIIGESVGRIVATLGQPDEIGDPIWVSDDEQQIPYEFFSLGLQFWVESGRVVSVFCNAIY